MRSSISSLLNPSPVLSLPAPHAPSSPSSSSSSPSSPLPSRHDDLRRNRDTSSRHRQAQRAALTSAQADLTALHSSRRALASQTAALVASSALPPVLPGALLSASPDYAARNTHDAFERFSPATAEILGVSAVSHPVAHVLLEIVAIRRRAAEICPKGLTPAEATRFTTHEYDALAGSLAYNADTGRPVPVDLHLARLEELNTLYVRWDAHEAMHEWFRFQDYAAGDDDEAVDSEDEENGDGGDYGTVIKRCRRCHVLKTAGSGHRRSHCDDGMLVSSDVPFPSASWADNSESAALSPDRVGGPL